MEESYRQVHETFVKNLQNGTDAGGPFEIFSITSFAFLPLLALPLLQELCSKHGAQSLHSSSYMLLLLELFFYVIPMTLSITILADYKFILYFSFIIFVLTLIFIKVVTNFKQNLTARSFKDAIQETASSPFIPSGNSTGNQQLLFLTEYRSCMFFCTAVCILAVDFNVFPRRFAKTETYGYSLMDCGVGSFILANGLVSPEARKITVNRNRFHSLLKSIISSIPLAVIGLIRLASVAATNYHIQVSEYGVHWNFFFTLVIIKISSSFLLCIFHPRSSGYICIAIIFVIEFSLSDQKLTHFLLYSEDRNGLVASNKEGLFSSLGFLAVYFIGIKIGQFLFHNSHKSSEKWLTVSMQLLAVSCAMYILHRVAHQYLQPSSRRLVNLTYLLWMVSLNISLLAVSIFGNLIKILLSRYLHQSSKINSSAVKSLVLQIISYNALFFFLIANLLTGLVNLSVQTVYTSTFNAVAILLGYIVVLLHLSFFLFKFKIKLKM